VVFKHENWVRISIPPNLATSTKLHFSKWNQSITTQNQKNLSAFHVWWARNYTFGAEAMAEGPPNMKCFKKKFKKQKKWKKKIWNFFKSTMIFLSQCTWPISMGETWCPQGPWAPSSGIDARCSRYPFLLLNVIQLSRPKKVSEYLPLKRVEGSSASTVLGPNFHRK
jgi:hypothetical protein